MVEERECVTGTGNGKSTHQHRTTHHTERRTALNTKNRVGVRGEKQTDIKNSRKNPRERGTNHHRLRGCVVGIGWKKKYRATQLARATDRDIEKKKLSTITGLCKV